MSTVLLSSAFDDDDPMMALFEPVKPAPPVAFHDDPVALSCAAYREGGYPRLETVTVTQPDRELAQQVRRHFMDKLVIQRLQGKPMSGFRDKLGAFLVDNRPLLENEIGILYRLPYFYHEDLAVQRMLDDTVPVEQAAPDQRTVELTPYQRIIVHRRGGAVCQYWWVDSQRQLYGLNVKENSESIHLYQSIWEFNSITVEASMFVKPFMGTDRCFYRLVRARLLGVA